MTEIKGYRGHRPVSSTQPRLLPRPGPWVPRRGPEASRSQCDSPGWKKGPDARLTLWSGIKDPGARSATAAPPPPRDTSHTHTHLQRNKKTHTDTHTHTCEVWNLLQAMRRQEKGAKSQSKEPRFAHSRVHNCTLGFYSNRLRCLRCFNAHKHIWFLKLSIPAAMYSSSVWKFLLLSL